MSLRILVAGLAVFLVAGCVSSRQYKARVAEVGELKTEVSTLSGQLEATKKLCDEDRAALAQANDRLKGKVAELGEANARLTRAMEDDRTGLSADIARLESEVRQQKLRVEELKQSLARREKEVESQKAELDRLNEELLEAHQEKKAAVKDLTGTYDALVGELQGEIDRGRVAINQLRDRLSVSMVDKVLFDSGSSRVKPQGKEVLGRVAGILRKVQDRQIRIEGHTDNVAIGPELKKIFPTNWELSTARATNVARYLQERGVNPRLLSVAGYAQYHPVASNDTEEGRARNRRIEIVLVPLEPEEAAPDQAR
ncbi:MAG: OmpA family protein [Nitrospirota bacterium]|jgi:chemotaxis protein MotB